MKPVFKHLIAGALGGMLVTLAAVLLSKKLLKKEKSLNYKDIRLDVDKIIDNYLAETKKELEKNSKQTVRKTGVKKLRRAI